MDRQRLLDLDRESRARLSELADKHGCEASSEREFHRGRLTVISELLVIDLEMKARYTIPGLDGVWRLMGLRTTNMGEDGRALLDMVREDRVE